jgi:hypothetical protein
MACNCPFVRGSSNETLYCGFLEGVELIGKWRCSVVAPRRVSGQSCLRSHAFRDTWVARHLKCKYYHLGCAQMSLSRA